MAPFRAMPEFKELQDEVSYLNLNIWELGSMFCKEDYSGVFFVTFQQTGHFEVMLIR